MPRKILEGGVIFEQEEIYFVRPRGGIGTELRGKRDGVGSRSHVYVEWQQKKWIMA
jgi:hypothetical protein